MGDSYSYKMKLFVVGCVFISYYIHVLVAKRKGCSFSVHGQSDKISPILVKKNNLIVPNNGKVKLKTRENITVLCPDSENYLENSPDQSNLMSVQCIQGKFLRLDNQDLTFDDLRCNRMIRGTVTTTKRKCGNGTGKIYKIGYKLEPRIFIELIQVCYNYQNGASLYTQHFLYGQDIKYASKSSYRPSFRSEGSAVQHVAVAYKQKFQKVILNNLLKSKTLADKYLNESFYFDRGHLSPDADFLFASTQYTSYYYINVSPQWHVINTRNWKKLEMIIRAFAETKRKTFKIITGTYGILTLPDVNGTHVEVYLFGDKLPIPKYFWKIVYEERVQQAVVLINLNNPFVRKLGRGEYLCENICNKVGWDYASWSDYGRGFVYCCDYNQFADEVKTAPKLSVVEVLQGPKP
jgi:hypothetical protein